jgi:hypothetical protein
MAYDQLGLLVSFLYYCITGVFTTDDAKNVCDGRLWLHEPDLHYDGHLAWYCAKSGCDGLVDFVVSSVKGSLRRDCCRPDLLRVFVHGDPGLVYLHAVSHRHADRRGAGQGCGANVGMCIGALVSTGVFGYAWRSPRTAA